MTLEQQTRYRTQMDSLLEQMADLKRQVDAEHSMVVGCWWLVHSLAGLEALAFAILDNIQKSRVLDNSGEAEAGEKEEE
jgi:hypothetical protein